jgi:hypothetical protein
MNFLYLFIFLTIVNSNIFGQLKYTNKQQEKCNLRKQKLISLEGDTLYLPDVINSKALILRFSVLSCNVCVDTIFSILRSYEKSIGKDNIIIFVYYWNIRDFFVTARVNGFSYKTYFIPDNKLISSIDVQDVPYLFILDSNYHCSQILYINDISKQKLLFKKYLSKMKL